MIERPTFFSDRAKVGNVISIAWQDYPESFNYAAGDIAYAMAKRL